MDSINQQQPEDNRKDLSSAEAISKMKELVNKAKTCFFCTRPAPSSYMEVRPMSVQQFDEEGNFWFLSADDSHKNEQLEINNEVQLLFQGSAHSDFLNVNGVASISKDKAKIRELWEPLVKTWFTEGVDDPRITVIRVQPINGYYWDTKHGNAIAFLKIATGALIGKTLDDSIEGSIRL